MGRLSGKKALVTAAGQGIGRAVAEAFCAEGADVVATDIRAESLDGLPCRTEVLDVTDAQAVQSLVASLGHIDVLASCAGIVHSGSILDCTPEEFDQAVAVNTRPLYVLARAVIPAMTSGGSLVVVSSVASSVKAVPNRFAYSTSKAALIGMVKSIAADFVADGIRANAICPGTVDSPSWRARVEDSPDPEKALADFVARQPMGRVGKPSEIAALAVYLASDESAFTTGTVNVVDGGWTA